MRLRLLLPLLALLCCSARAAEDGAPVTLRYFLGGTLGAGEQDQVQEFERRNPDIKVVAGLSVSRNMVEDPQRLLCAIVGGDPPDLVIFDRYAVAEWAARGAFMPLDEFIYSERYLAAAVAKLMARAGKFPAEPTALVQPAVDEILARPGLQLGALALALQRLVEHYTGEHLSSDLVRELDSVVGRFFVRSTNRIDPGEYFPACWDEATWEGEVYAIPTGTDNRALFYNKDLLRAAGLVGPDGEAKPPRTWDELEDYALKLSEFTRDREGKISTIRRVGFIPNFGNSWFYFYSWLNDGQLLSDDGRTCTLASPENVEAMQYVTDLYDKLGGAPLVNAFQSSFQGAELDPFLTGRVAMKIDGNWVLNNIGNFKRELNFGVAPAPMPRTRLEAGKPYISWAGGWSWVIPKGARHPEEAWRLINWLASEEAALILNDAAREASLAQGKMFIPGLHANKRITQTLYRRYLAEDPSVEQKFRDAYQVFMNLLPESRFRPVTPVGQFLWNQQVRAMEGAIYHRGTVEEVLVDHAKEVQRELDRIYRIRTEPVVNWSVPLIAYVAALIATALILWWRHNRLSRSTGYFRKEHRAGVAFALPWIIGFIVFTGGPIVFSFIISFCEYDVLSPGRWVGFSNYRYLLAEDPVFWKSLGNTLFMLIGLPLGMGVSLALAMLLNQKVKGMSAWRTFFYLPAIMPGVAAALLWVWMFQPTHGLLNRLFDIVGLNWLLARLGVSVPVLWLQSELTSKPALILMGLWSAGAGMIIWLAGLKGIPEHLYEAAEIDGAGRWQKFRHITLPMLTPYIFFNLLMGMIGTLQVFESAYIMTAGGPVDSTLFFGYHLFNNAFRFFRMGQASAMAWVLCLMVLVITVIQLRTAKIWVHYESE